MVLKAQLEFKGYKVAVKISKDGNSGIILMSNNSNGQTSDSNSLLETVKKVYIRLMIKGWEL